MYPRFGRKSSIDFFFLLDLTIKSVNFSKFYPFQFTLGYLFLDSAVRIFSMTLALLCIYFSPDSTTSCQIDRCGF